MRTTAYVIAAIIISIVSCTCGYTVGCRNGYIHALIDKMNNIQPKYILKEKEDKQVVWTEDLNYNGISRAIRKGNLSE